MTFITASYNHLIGKLFRIHNFIYANSMSIWIAIVGTIPTALGGLSKISRLLLDNNCLVGM